MSEGRSDTRREAQYITLRAWAERKFDPVPHRNTLQRWAEDGCIQPPPFKLGRDYMVSPTARHIKEPTPGKSLADRLRHGLPSP
jgi:hypothetical protein